VRRCRTSPYRSYLPSGTHTTNHASSPDVARLPGELVTIDPLLAAAAFGIGIVVGLTGMGGGALAGP
jgi:uncharacterized membrane protein YfcA